MPKSGPEYGLQVKVNQFVREFVAEPKFFTAIDRTMKLSQFSHVREKARGLVAGCPDTLLIVPDMPAIMVELKAPGNKVDEGSAQERVGHAIRYAGHLWNWVDSVTGYAHLLDYYGVKMQGAWMLAAKHADAVLEAAAIRKEEKKTGTVSKRRFSDPRPTKGQLKRVEKIRASGIRI